MILALNISSCELLSSGSLMEEKVRRDPAPPRSAAKARACWVLALAGGVGEERRVGPEARKSLRETEARRGLAQGRCRQFCTANCFSQGIAGEHRPSCVFSPFHSIDGAL